MQKDKFNLIYIFRISIITAMGGLLFGYDWVVIGGAKPFYEEYFALVDSFEIGWAMSNALLGCIVGALASGYFTDRYGRKIVLIVSGMLFTLSALGTAYSETFTFFVWARIIGGVGIGLASNVSPMYISEIAPPKYRGRLVSINQLTIVLGILAAQIINWQIADPVPEGATSSEILNSWNGQIGWRWMFGAEVVPAFLFFALAFIIPESPRWLAKMGKSEEARKILDKIGGENYASKAIDEVNATLSADTESFGIRELTRKPLLPILILGISIAVLQQWCGINIIFNYADEIFTSAGYGVSDMLLNVVITGSVNLIFTLVALQVVDRWGRRKLMLLGFGSLSVIYIIMSYFFYTGSEGLHLLILVVLSIAVYAMSLAPVTWVVISEIFPNRVRGAAMSVSIFALWFSSMILTLTFPVINSSLGEGAQGTAYAFILYAIICIAGFFYLKKNLPETKGKSLEEIENELTKPKSL